MKKQKTKSIKQLNRSPVAAKMQAVSEGKTGETPLAR